MYREVTMIEVREVLRLRGAGLPKKRIAAQLGLDPKTVRRYLEAAATAGDPPVLRRDAGRLLFVAGLRAGRCRSACRRPLHRDAQVPGPGRGAGHRALKLGWPTKY